MDREWLIVIHIVYIDEVQQRAFQLSNSQIWHIKKQDIKIKRKQGNHHMMATLFLLTDSDNLSYAKKNLLVL